MEDACDIVLFGDEITQSISRQFEQRLKRKYPNNDDIDIDDLSAQGETSQDGRERLDLVIEKSPDVAVVDFGFNDWKYNIDTEIFYDNISTIVKELKLNDIRVIPATIHPVEEGPMTDDDQLISEYNEAIRDIAQNEKIKIADVHRWWQREQVFYKSYLKEDKRPNESGRDLICQSLLHVVPQSHTVILWQYNGRTEANCNYDCPYCYYPTKNENFSFGNPEEWKNRFKQAFGDQDLVFYFAFAEPTIAHDFFDYVKMIGSEPNWKLRITTNLSLPIKSLERLVNTELAKDGRLFLNASFHPTQTSIDKFIKKLLFLRNNGIEAPVVYVMWPPQVETFDEHFKRFDEHEFIVHVRAYQGEDYPDAYTEEQRRKVAKYMDDASIIYNLNRKVPFDRHTFAGFHFYVVDSAGNVGIDSNTFQWDSAYRTIYGNIIQSSSLDFPTGPIKYPKGNYPKTVDGVSNLLEANLNQLEDNNVISYAKQGGVYKAADGVVYENRTKDFDDPKVRAKYHFPSRNLIDTIYRIKYQGVKNTSVSLWTKHIDYRLNLYLKHGQKSYEREGLFNTFKKAYKYFKGELYTDKDTQREVVKQPLNKDTDQETTK